MIFHKKTKKQKNKKFYLHNYLFLFTFLFILFNISYNFVSAQTEDLDVFEFIPKAENYDYSDLLKNPYLAVYSNLSLSVFLYNDYYTDLYYTGAINKEPDSILYVYDENNNLLEEFPFYEKEINIIPYNENYRKIQLNNQIKEAIFCNFNNICENNQDNLLENSIICNDCEKSSQDNYCELNIDNICDPDCPDFDYDCDCIYCDKFKEHWPEGIPETCDVFSGKICALNETCTGSFINAIDTERCCIKGDCIIKETSKKISSKDLFFLAISLFIFIAFIIFLIVLIKKKKLITISLFYIIIILIFSLNALAQQQLTREQTISEICKVANQYQEKGYNLPASALLTIAEMESNINHYCHGCAHCIDNVCVSFDGGVGIMQIDHGFSPETIPKSGPFYACGNSDIDGRKLDIKKISDNIECGAKEILSKCRAAYGVCSVLGSCECNINSNCLDPNLKCEYTCEANNYFKTYTGMDIAIKGYNGWGCGPFEANRKYVETFHNRESKYLRTCSSSPPLETPPVKDVPNQDKADIINFILNKNGYYYLSSIIKTSFSFNLSKQDNELIFINKLIEEAHKCMFDIKYDCSSGKPFICLDENDNVQECQSSNQILTCKNTLKTYQECARIILEKFKKDNWHLDYCPSDEEEKECYQKGKIWEDKCISKPSDYEKNSILKFCIETGEELPYFDEKTKKYYQKPLNIKFALDINGNEIKLDKFGYNDIKDIEKNTLSSTEKTQDDIKLPQPSPQPLQQTNPISYQKLFEEIKTKMGGNFPLYTDCTDDIADWAWCWVHSGCHGIGIYCKKDKLEKASQSYLAQLFIHEITHNLQSGRCSNRVESEWGAEYYSGSSYYCFKVGNNWLKASQVAQIMKQNGCSDNQLVSTAFCKNKCPNPATEVRSVKGGC